MRSDVGMRSKLCLLDCEAGKSLSLRLNILRMKKLLFLRRAKHVDVHLSIEPGVLLRSFQLLDTNEQYEDPVQEWGEEVEDGAVFGITLHREPVQASPDTVEFPAAFSCIQYHTVKVRRLKAATLERLVAHLLERERQEPDFTQVFLSTYRAFTCTRALIELLFHSKDDSAVTLEASVSPRSTLIPLLRLWLEEYSEDFRDPPQHQALRLLCTHLRRRICFRRLAQTADSLFKRLQAAEHHSEAHKLEEHGDEEGSGDMSSNRQDFIDFPVKKVAEQLARLDTELFVRVVPFHCLGCVWSNRDKKGNQKLAPSVRATIAQFNAVTSRVITSLLCPPAAPCPTSSPNSSSVFVYSSLAPGSPRSAHSSPAHRARVIEWWIAVAQECRQLKNFSSLRAILSALQSNAIYRLKKTWAAVSRECMSTFDQLCETFPDENCVLATREILLEDDCPNDDSGTGRPKSPKLCPISKQLSSSTGVVPYLGTYLTVLTMLDTALPDTVEGGLINFEKRRREFEVLSQICQFQASCSSYSLPLSPDITAWLKAHSLLTDQESYELSRNLEPPLDPCPGSPSSWSHRLLNKKFTSLITANADQISVSSGSSGSDMEDLSTQRLLKRQPLSGSLRNICDEVSSTSSSSMSSLSPNPSTSSFSSSNPDLSSPSLGQSPENKSSSCSRRSPLPIYNKQGADSCIVRVSVESGNNGNIYKSILLTSQDHTSHVIQRALEKHNMDGIGYNDFSLCQVLNTDKELQIPDKANVFYAMCTTANYDFILRQRWRSHGRHFGSSSSLGAQSRNRNAK